MVEESLIEEVESELKPVDTTWWIFRVLSIRLVLVFFCSLFFTIGLNSNGVTNSYLFGVSAFFLLLAFFNFGDHHD